MNILSMGSITGNSLGAFIAKQQAEQFIGSRMIGTVLLKDAMVALLMHFRGIRIIGLAVCILNIRKFPMKQLIIRSINCMRLMKSDD